MKTKTLFEIALPVALNVRDQLAPLCELIHTAGSLRRNEREVGDIEMVAKPKPVMDMFGTPSPLTTDHALNHFDYSKIGKVLANGPKQKKIMLNEGIQLDLFIVTPPAQWGVIFLLRTGPAEYSHRLVTKREHGGMLPGYLRVDGGAIWNGENVIETPEEEDVYRLLELPYEEPNQRGVNR